MESVNFALELLTLTLKHAPQDAQPIKSCKDHHVFARVDSVEMQLADAQTAPAFPTVSYSVDIVSLVL